MANPLISVITPTLNQAFSIRETIESVLGQSYSHFEYLIFDGGSTDGTLDILNEYKNEPNLNWVSSRDAGQSQAINKGLSACRGALFNWLNSDDLLEKDALQRIAEAFLHNPEKDVFSGFTDEFHHHSNQIFNRTSLQLRESVEETMTVGVFCQPSTFWRTQVLRDLGGLREDLHYTMDYDLWLRYLLAFGQARVLKLNSALARYRHHKGSKTSQSSSSFYQDTEAVFDALNFRLGAPASFISNGFQPAVFKTKTPLAIHRNFHRQRYLGKFCDRRVRMERLNNKPEARRWLWRSFRYTPWTSLWRLKMACRFLFESILRSVSGRSPSPAGKHP